MANRSNPSSLPPFELPRGTQPGGEGFFSRCEIAWGGARRWLLRRLCPGHVARWRALRQGEDTQLDRFVIDPRDLKYIRPICNFWFSRDIDVYARREQFGFARWGYAELVGFSLILLATAGVCFFFAGAVHWLFLLPALAAVAAELEILWFFRDPPRKRPTDPSALVSPADGTVSHVETIDDPDFPGPVLRISIFLSIFNVHVNRVPRAGQVMAIRYFRGEYLDARHADCARRNEQLWIDLADAATGAPLRVKQIAGAIARRICCALKPGDQVTIGERFGMIKFGSRTDVLVPAERVAEVIVKVGDKVKGASTVLLRMRQ
jgi:phosphatidylserine decarboxylase